MLRVSTCVVTPFQQNCRLLTDTSTDTSVLIDPGGEAPRLKRLIQDSDSALQAIALTHSHIDHCAGVAGLLREFEDVPLIGSEIESDMRAGIGNQALMFGLSPREYEACPEPTELLTDNGTMSVGTCESTCLFTPGHSPGHFAFFFSDVEFDIDGRSGSGPVVIAGDALFSGSIGRTDLPGGNHAQLIESIKTRLLTLPDQTVVLCGHGPETTIAQERQSNPFL